MGRLVDDELLETFAVVGPMRGIAAHIHERYDGAADRISFYTPVSTDQAVRRALVKALTACP